MKSIRHLLAAMIACVCIMVPICAFAASSISIERYVIDEGNEVVIYITGEEASAGDISYQIQQTECEVLDATTIGNQQNPIHTIILWDNSLSVMSKKEAQIRGLLTDIVANRTEGEDFCIASIDKEVTKLIDYTNDYAALKNVIDSTEKSDKDAYLIENLYDVITQLIALDSTDFYRIVVVSDGVDTTASGVSLNELNDLLKTNPYPIYTINTGGGSANVVKDMFSISRSTGTSYFSIVGDEAVDNQTILNTLREDAKVLKVTATYPDKLKDGSDKNSQLTVNGNKYEFYVKMPFDIEAISATPEPQVAVATPTPMIVEVAPSPTPVPLSTPQKILLFLGGLPWIIIIPVLVGIGLIVLIVLLIINSTKKKKEKEAAYQKAREAERNALNAGIRNDYNNFDSDATQMVGKTVSYGDDGKTVQLFDAPQTSRRIVLTNTKNPSERYERDLGVQPVSIGRKPSNKISITTDPTVSGSHCEVYMMNGQTYVRDVGSSNGTKVNDSGRISNATPLNTGDTLTLGNAEYRILIK